MAKKLDSMTVALSLFLILGLSFLTYSGVLFALNLKEVAWDKDNIYIAVNTVDLSNDGGYQCFGCNPETCLYPSSIMAIVEESEEIHCAPNFAVEGDFEAIFLSPPDLENIPEGQKFDRIYRIDQIVLFETDSGELICIGDNGLGVFKDPPEGYLWPRTETIGEHCNEFFSVVGTEV